MWLRNKPCAVKLMRHSMRSTCAPSDPDDDGAATARYIDYIPRSDARTLPNDDDVQRPQTRCFGSALI